jgi:hypothetical protein
MPLDPLLGAVGRLAAGHPGLTPRFSGQARGMLSRSGRHSAAGLPLNAVR